MKQQGWAEAVLAAWKYCPERDGPTRPEVCESGGQQLGVRLSMLADFSAANVEGDLCEIGAWRGETTVRLAGVAQKAGRRVLVVDPWDGGAQCSPAADEGAYAEFLENVHNWRSLLRIIRLPSQSLAAVAELRATPLCFVYIDGLHTYEGVASDLSAVVHCKGIVAVGDFAWNEGIRQAVREAGRAYMAHGACREAYVLPEG